MKDWRVETLYDLSPARQAALEKAATAEAACGFCGQAAGLWCRVSQKEFVYTPSPHMARKFGWLDLAGPEFALVLLDAVWTPANAFSNPAAAEKAALDAGLFDLLGPGVALVETNDENTLAGRTDIIMRRR